MPASSPGAGDKGDATDRTEGAAASSASFSRGDAQFSGDHRDLYSNPQQRETSVAEQEAKRSRPEPSAAPLAVDMSCPLIHLGQSLAGGVDKEQDEDNRGGSLLSHTIFLSKTMTDSPEGALALAMLSQTCTFFGKAKEKGELPLIAQWAQRLCFEAGVRRLPLTMGGRWCWSRMLSWLSQAVRVGPQHKLKTIEDGFDAAAVKHFESNNAGATLEEGSALVLVEPGVYEEGLQIAEEESTDELCVSIWGCDRQIEPTKPEMQTVEWRSRDRTTVVIRGNVSISVNGMIMSAMKSEGGGFVCVGAADGATLCLERCDLTCQDAAVVQAGGSGTVARMSECCIHDGNQSGIYVFDRARATLENNDIHSHTMTGVFVQGEGSEVVLRNNRIHHGKQAGVYVFENAHATLESNDIYSNVRAGVRVEESGEAEIICNRIYDGRAAGIVVCKNSKANLEHNVITANDLTGIYIIHHGAVCLAGNTVMGNGYLKMQCESDIKQWSEGNLKQTGIRGLIAYYRAGVGMPGLVVQDHSTYKMAPGANTIEGNGNLANAGKPEKILVDETSSWRPHRLSYGMDSFIAPPRDLLFDPPRPQIQQLASHLQHDAGQALPDLPQAVPDLPDLYQAPNLTPLCGGGIGSVAGGGIAPTALPWPSTGAVYGVTAPARDPGPAPTGTSLWTSFAAPVPVPSAHHVSMTLPHPGWGVALPFRSLKASHIRCGMCSLDIVVQLNAEDIRSRTLKPLPSWYCGTFERKSYIRNCHNTLAIVNISKEELEEVHDDGKEGEGVWPGLAKLWAQVSVNTAGSPPQRSNAVSSDAISGQQSHLSHCGRGSIQSCVRAALLKHFNEPADPECPGGIVFQQEMELASDKNCVFIMQSWFSFDESNRELVRHSTLFRHHNPAKNSRPGKRPADTIFVDNCGAGPATPVHTRSLCSLIALPVELIQLIVSTLTDGVSVALVARTCTFFGKAAKKGELPRAWRFAETMCKELGVCRLPVTRGDGWSWPRMLSWLSHAVRVGPQHKLKKIQEGVTHAAWQSFESNNAGATLEEGSALVLVEPGVYEEGLQIAEEESTDELCVSIWGCDRQIEPTKPEMQTVEWRSRDRTTVVIRGNVSISVNGMIMSAMKTEGGGFVCVGAADGATLCLERCDLTCEDGAVVQAGGNGTVAVVNGCTIHDGNGSGVYIFDRAKGTLENNDIARVALTGVIIRDEGSDALLRNNHIHHGAAAGVFSFGHACVTLEDNVITANERANVRIDDGSKSVIKGNRICDGLAAGIAIIGKSVAIIQNNIICTNDLSGIAVDDHVTATITGNKINDNGHCDVSRPETLLAHFPPHYANAYRTMSAGCGFPGVWFIRHSTINMPAGSNTISGNGKSGCNADQVVQDETCIVLQHNLSGPRSMQHIDSRPSKTAPMGNQGIFTVPELYLHRGPVIQLYRHAQQSTTPVSPLYHRSQIEQVELPRGYGNRSQIEQVELPRRPSPEAAYGAVAVVDEKKVHGPLVLLPSRLHLPEEAFAVGPSCSEAACLLLNLPADLLGSILFMFSPEGAVCLSLLSRTCTFFGKVKEKGGLSLLSQWTQLFCQELGVRRLPLTMGDGWCWPRMLSWLSQAVRVGAQCELKTIEEGVEAACVKQNSSMMKGKFSEVSTLVLVEPGVYEEGLQIADGQNHRVSIWGCDRQIEPKKPEMQKVEWRGKNASTLTMCGNVSISVNGMHMSAMKSEGGGFVCVGAADGATLCLERCDLTCQDGAVVQIGGQCTKAMLSHCSVHDGNQAGIFIGGKAKATLENNDIHSHALTCVQVQDEGTEIVLRGNCIHDGKQAGVYIFGKAKGTLDNNSISKNTRAGVRVDDNSDVMLTGNRVCNGNACGVLICTKANAVLVNNRVEDNDLAGIGLYHATATLTGNSIKGNGQCKIVWSEEELVGWQADWIAAYRGRGFPGMSAYCYSTIAFPYGSNVVEGNGKIGTQVDQVKKCKTSNILDAAVLPGATADKQVVWRPFGSDAGPSDAGPSDAGPRTVLDRRTGPANFENHL